MSYHQTSAVAKSDGSAERNRFVDQRNVEDVIVELLAEGRPDVTADELRQELLAAGEDLPIDSVLATEIVVAVQNRFGIRMPAEGVEEYLRSVRAFAAQVCALAGEAEEARGA